MALNVAKCAVAVYCDQKFLTLRVTLYFTFSHRICWWSGQSSLAPSFHHDEKVCIYLKNRIIVYQFELLHAANKLRPASKHSDWRGEIRAGEPGCSGRRLPTPAEGSGSRNGNKTALRQLSSHKCHKCHTSRYYDRIPDLAAQIKYSPTSKRNLTVSLYF